MTDRLWEHPRFAFCGQALPAGYGGPAKSDVESELAGADEGSLSPSRRGWLEYTDGELCQEHDPHRALAHYAAAVTFCARSSQSLHRRGSDRFGVLAARVGHPREALDAFAEAIHHWIRLASTTAAGDTTQPRRTVPAR